MGKYITLKATKQEKLYTGLTLVAVPTAFASITGLLQGYLCTYGALCRVQWAVGGLLLVTGICLLVSYTRHDDLMNQAKEHEQEPTLEEKKEI